MNCDIRRDTGFVRAVTSFMERMGLISVWEKFPVDFTHVHTDLKNFSILDNFFVNKDLLDQVEDAGPVHCVTNLSRHSPIMMKLKLKEALPSKVPIKNLPQPRRPAWLKASENDKHLYTTLLEEKLQNISEPKELTCTNVKCKCEKHNEARDKFVLDIMTAAIESSHQQ